MLKLSSGQVAKKLGIGTSTLSRYILTGKIPAPEETMAGGMRMRLWTERDIQRLREFLPKIADGRKTRYLKKHLAVSTKKKKPQAGAAHGGPGSSTVPHENPASVARGQNNDQRAHAGEETPTRP